MVAPLLIPVLTTLAEKGLSLIGSALLAKGKDVVEKELGVNIDDALMTEEGTEKLRIAQMEHEEKLIELALEDRKLDASYYQIDAADRASAREREIAVMQNAENAGWLNLNLVPILALLMVVGGLSTLYFHPDTEVRMASVSLLTLVLGYYFGNSSSNWKKDNTINRLATNQPKE